MTTVSPKDKFYMKASNTDTKDLEKEIGTIANLIRGVSPFMDTVLIHNDTKKCNVDVAFNNGQMVIRITNPDDEIFTLED
jgi:hypothetical protein